MGARHFVNEAAHKSYIIKNHVQLATAFLKYLK